MDAKEVCETAAALVSGDRAEEHGDMHEVHGLAAELWGAWKGDTYTARDVAMMMILLKVARSFHSPRGKDNYVDIAGYAGIAAQLSNEIE